MEKKKLTPKQKQERKEFVKKQLFKILHSIGYVCIFLVVLFSILMGVQNCKNRSSKNNNVSSNLQPQTQQRVKYSGSQRVLYYEIIDNNGTIGLNGCRIDFNFDYFVQNIKDNSYLNNLNINRLIFEFREDLDADSSDKFVSLYNSQFVNSGIVTSLGIVWSSNEVEVYLLDEGNYVGILYKSDFSGNVTYNGFYDYFVKIYNSNNHNVSLRINNSVDANCFLFTHNDRFLLNNVSYTYDFSNLFANLFPIQQDTFNFVYDLNLVSFYSTNLSGAISLGGFTIGQYNSGMSYLINGRPFLCNGRVYTQMRIVGVELNNGADSFTTDGTNVQTWNVSGVSYFAPLYLEYANTDLNYSITACYLVHLNINNSVASYLNNYRWSNVVYQNITFLDKGFAKPMNFYTQNQADSLTLLNNGNNNNIGSVTSYSLGTGNNNVFVWLRSAFGSLTDIFAIALLPGVTVGILIFLPMVVTIIIVIFKLIKK